jgi:hypothetical protein
MLDLSLFRIPRFVGVQVLPVSTCCCYIVLLVVLPLRFIGIDGFSEIDAGWLMLGSPRRCSSCRWSRRRSRAGCRPA